MCSCASENSRALAARSFLSASTWRALETENRDGRFQTYFLFQTLDLLVLGLDLLACLRLGRLQGHPQGLGLFFVQGGLLLRLGRSVRQLVSSPDC